MKRFGAVIVILLACINKYVVCQSPSGCQLQIGSSAAVSFDACFTLNDLSPAAPFVWYAKLTSNATSAGTTWRGGLKVGVDAVKGGWAGFGPGYAMLGSSVVVVKKCPTCPGGARVDGYKLTSFDPAQLVAGSFPLRDATAAVAADGSLVASFTYDVTGKTPAQLSAVPFQYIYAIGPSATDGTWQSHTTPGFPFGSKSMSLSSGSGSSNSSSSGTPASATAASSTTSPSNATGSTTCVLSLSPSTAAQKFSGCTPMGGSNAMTVMWNANPVTTASNVTIQFGIKAPLQAGQYVSIGFPSSPGKMTGAVAMVLSACSSCPGGASVQQYYLAGQTTSDASLSTRLLVSGMQSSSTGVAIFTVSMPATSVAGGQLPVIYAAGPLDASGHMAMHATQGSATINLASGSASGDDGDSSKELKLKIHAWFMGVGWTMILAGAVLAKSFKEALGNPLWFRLHRGLQVTGLLLVIPGFVIAFDALNWTKSSYTLHYNLGIAAFALGMGQSTALIFRPALDSRYRRIWAVAHHWVGYSAVLLSVADIYDGLINVKNVGQWPIITYSSIFGFILLLGALKEAYEYVRLPPPSLMQIQVIRLDPEGRTVPVVVNERDSPWWSPKKQRPSMDGTDATTVEVSGGSGTGSDSHKAGPSSRASASGSSNHGAEEV